MRVEVTHAISDKADVLDNHKDRHRGLFNRDRFLVMDESFIAEKDYQMIRPGPGVDGPMLTQNPTRLPAQEAVSDRRGYVPLNLIPLPALAKRLALSGHFFSVWFFATVKAMLTIATYCILTLLLLSTVVDFDIHVYLRGCSSTSNIQTLRLFTSTLAADRLNQHSEFGAPIRFGHLAVAVTDEHSPWFSVPDVPTYCSLALHWGLVTGARLDDSDKHTNIFVEDGQSSDFAAIEDGAQVIGSLTSLSFSPRPPQFRPDIALWHWFSSHGGDKTWPAEAALSSGTELGQCWAYAGASGQLGIQLSDRISIFAIAIHHPLHESSLQSAPRGLELWGLHTQAIEISADANVTDTTHVTNHPSPSPHLGPRGGLHILSGVFNATSGERQQVFTLQNASYTGIAFESVVVQIVDNWGKDKYTCVYRIEIIGRHADNS